MIHYYDFYAESTSKAKVFQSFPFVKVRSIRIFLVRLLLNHQAALLDLHNDGKLNFKSRIIASDGGPGHFKVYQTQNWMSRWCSQLNEIYTEWNMFFANLGHNVCDGHAG